MLDPKTAHSGASSLATSTAFRSDARSGTRTPARLGLAAAAGAMAAAFLASLCCVGPLVFVAFGVGAGLASTFEPLRPLFTVLTVALLGLGFYVVYGNRPAEAYAACTPNATCAVPRNRRRDKFLLWIVTILALAFLTFPRWSVFLV